MLNSFREIYTTLWYPVLKNIAKTFGKKLTKDIVKGQIDKFVPIVGFALGGIITYCSFGPCCKKLVKELRNTILSNPNYVEPVTGWDKVSNEDMIENKLDDNVNIEGTVVSVD